jgi:hypothetical protein
MKKVGKELHQITPITTFNKKNIIRVVHKKIQNHYN